MRALVKTQGGSSPALRPEQIDGEELEHYRVLCRYARRSTDDLLQDWLADQGLDVPVYVQLAADWNWEQRAPAIRRDFVERKGFALWAESLDVASTIMPDLVRLASSVSDQLGKMESAEDDPKKDAKIDALLVRMERVARIRQQLLRTPADGGISVSLTQQTAVVDRRSPPAPAMAGAWQTGSDRRRVAGADTNNEGEPG